MNDVLNFSKNDDFPQYFRISTLIWYISNFMNMSVFFHKVWYYCRNWHAYRPMILLITLSQLLNL